MNQETFPLTSFIDYTASKVGGSKKRMKGVVKETEVNLL